MVREDTNQGEETGEIEQYISYVAEEGDDLASLAKQTGLDEKELIAANPGLKIEIGTSPPIWRKCCLPL